MTARPVVASSDRGEGRRHLMVEIAPAELTEKALGAGPADHTRDDLPRRQTAEVQMGAQVRGRIGPEVVAIDSVTSQSRPDPRRQPGAADGLTTGRQLG